MDGDSKRASVALCLMAALGVALVFLFPGSPEQDTDYHFLMARTAWVNPTYFVGVWARPLYTVVFAVCGLAGFTGGRICGVGVGLLLAWQTWRLARDLKMERAWLVAPLLLAQPVFFELYPDMLTEPLFGLLFVVAVRWHLRGWTKRAMLLASLTPLARPEGFFLGVLWGAWVLAAAAKSEESRPVFVKIARAIPSTLLLATGAALWWLAAFAISRDPLFIQHNWPNTWVKDMYGQGTFFSYAQRGWEFTGVLLCVPCVLGLWKTLPNKNWMPLTSATLLMFVLHSVFRRYGLFGEAGYPRYMVTVSSAVALLTLQGWNTIAALLAGWPRGRAALGWGVLAVSLAQSFLYLDGFYWARDAVAIRDTTAWLRDHPSSYTKLVWSNARMCIDLGENLEKSPALNTKGDATADLLRNAPSGTLVFWDDHIGPDWFGMSATQIEQCGYKLLRTQRYSLPGVVGYDPFGRKVQNFDIEVSLLQKP